MRTLIGMVLGTALAAGLASPVAAQRRFMSMARPAMPVRATVVRVSAAMLPSRGVTVGPIRTRIAAAQTALGTATSSSVGLGTAPIVTNAIGGFAPLSVSQLLNPVPGLGFDFSHLAAVNENLDIRALIDPVTQQRLALAERLLRETAVLPVVFPAFATSPVVVIESPPQVVVVEQPAAAQAPAPAPAAVQASAAVAAPVAPPLPVGDLLLVRRDGSRIRAAAFTQAGSQIVYITNDGQRHSIALANLDVDATLRANEARGTFLRFSL